VPHAPGDEREDAEEQLRAREGPEIAAAQGSRGVAKRRTKATMCQILSSLQP
jgi:hypothetical protein